nr:MAG TPA: hypothetical protein [Caudoviricetes sp.]
MGFLRFGQQHHAHADFCTTMRTEGGGVDYRLCVLLCIFFFLLFFFVGKR